MDDTDGELMQEFNQTLVGTLTAIHNADSEGLMQTLGTIDPRDVWRFISFTCGMFVGALRNLTDLQGIDMDEALAYMGLRAAED